MNRLRTCKACGWVHFAVSEKQAKQEILAFNEYYNELSKEKQDEYYGGKSSSLDHYLYCNSCGEHWTGFRESIAGDCPPGCTIGPIVYEEKE